jgi:predicted N-acetyltransferase YhbS
VSVTVRLGTTDDLPAVAELYQEWGYRSSASPDDTLIIAAHDGRVVGVVRLAMEFGHLVLRGMRVQPAFQRTGVGSQMLELLVKQVKKRECYGIPYEHLLAFYGRAGFRQIEEADAPAFLAQRAASYRAEGLKVVIIRRSP